MKRLIMIALCAGLLSFTGCATCQKGGSCSSGQCHNECNSGQCGSCKGHGGGLLGKLKSHGSGSCQSCQGGVAVGCRPGPLHWQQGGLDYSEGLAAGLCNSRAQQGPVNPGPPSGTVGYPYYTTRGPRDFLLDNPPSIGR